MSFEKIKKNVSNYYTRKIEQFDATYKGVDWNSQSSQELRFEQLLKICLEMGKFTLNDIGCGYGALYEYMKRMGFRDFIYWGYDISTKMIETARKRFASTKNCLFFEGDDFKPSDYSAASGIFNVKLDTADNDWKDYVVDTINRMNKVSRKGFAFNMLTKYSDKEYMRNDLFYGDPCFFFDYCKKNFSRNVALLHDYELYEFTIMVRKEV